MRSPNRLRRPPRKPGNPVNEDIRAREVRLIGPEGEKIGIVRTEDALQQARDAGLDLVEVASDAAPPVCRILDYNKMQYERQRKQREARKHQRHTETKEVKLRPNIDEHDYQTKLKHLRDFIQKGHKAKVTLMFRAREMRRYEVGLEVVKRMVDDVQDIAVSEPVQRSHARTISALVGPNKEILARVEKELREEIAHEKEDEEKKRAARHAKQGGRQKDEEQSSQEEVASEQPASS